MDYVSGESINDEATVRDLVEGNMRLAHFYAAKGYEADQAEALSVAMDGLLRAARSWDGSRGLPFHTYASILIVRRFNDRRAKAWRRRHINSGLSINAQLEGGDGDEFGDLLPDERAVSPAAAAADSEERSCLRRAIRALPKTKRMLVIARFGEDRTLQEIGDEFQISRERVRQIVREAMETLRGSVASLSTGGGAFRGRDWKPSLNPRIKLGGRFPATRLGQPKEKR